MEWAIVTYRVPKEPSRHRVAIWRELRRAGAVPLQQATWALPIHPATNATIDRVMTLVERAEGEALVFDASPRDETVAAAVEAAFIEGREEEWREFVRECDKFDAEIDREIATEKFTPAELDEEEQNLERLQRWHRELRSRDILGAPSAAEAELGLKSCAERLEAFAQQVFEVGGGT
jgi:ChrB-like protein